jgi:hypothetical protein
MRSYKAFVSSTFVDLKAHRAGVIAGLRKAGFFVDPMEDWTAATDEPKRFSQARLLGCDLCILLVARRRGHVPRGERLSITQMEAAAARRLGIPILVFMLADNARWPRRFDERARDAALLRWRGEHSQVKGVGWFDADPRSIEIAPALTRWIAENTVGARDEALARLAQKATDEVVRLVLAVQLAERRALKSQQEYDDAYHRWERATAEIAGELAALSSDLTLAAAWHRLSDATCALYRLSGTWSQPWRSELLAEMKVLFLPEATDWSELAAPLPVLPSNEAFQRYFAAWWRLRELLLSGCSEFGRRLRAA